MIKTFSRISVTRLLMRIEKLATANNDAAILEFDLLDTFHNRIPNDVFDRSLGHLVMSGLVTRQYVGGTDHDEEGSFSIWLTSEGWTKCFDIHEKRESAFISVIWNLVFLLIGALFGKFL